MLDTGPVATTTIDGTDFQIMRIDAVKQFHIARRLAPAMAAILPALGIFDKIKSLGSEDGESGPMVYKEGAFREIIGELPAIARVFADMTDSDAEYVINAALDVCYRKQATGWARVRSGGVTMLADLTMPTIMQLVFAAIKGNMESYFPTGQPKVSAAGL